VGPQGSKGDTGNTGPKGDTGDTGSPGSGGSSAYAYLFNNVAQVVAVSAPVAFSGTGVMGGGFTVVAGSELVVPTSGDYDLSFSISGTEPSQFALYVNGTVVPQTRYGSGAGTQQNNGRALVHLQAADRVKLVNDTSAAAVGLAAAIGGAPSTVNASLIIEKLN
jgi:hypothetical protein